MYTYSCLSPQILTYIHGPEHCYAHLQRSCFHHNIKGRQTGSGSGFCNLAILSTCQLIVARVKLPVTVPVPCKLPATVSGLVDTPFVLLAFFSYTSSAHLRAIQTLIYFDMGLHMTNSTTLEPHKAERGLNMQNMPGANAKRLSQSVTFFLTVLSHDSVKWFLSNQTNVSVKAAKSLL